MNAHLQINSQIPAKKGGVRLLNNQLFKGGGKPLKRIADEGWEKEKLVIFVFGVKLCGLSIKALCFYAIPQFDMLQNCFRYQSGSCLIHLRNKIKHFFFFYKILY